MKMIEYTSMETIENKDLGKCEMCEEQVVIIINKHRLCDNHYWVMISDDNQ